MKKELIIEDGIIAGNIYDKYGTGNPIEKYLVAGFIHAVDKLFCSTNACNIHEIGCGEGHLSIALARRHPGVRLRACDLSQQVINLAIDNSIKAGVDIKFQVASVYDLSFEENTAELVVCCEVLEHLEYPGRALEVLCQLANPYLIVSVPHEPIWSILNLIRGKYLTRLGNTPGHVQRWSKASFIQLIDSYMDIIEVLTPLPWIIVLCRRRTMSNLD
ncbi:MAG: methyltransferase domain-containing protein [Chroococcidiopsidaceae cyanobacterium CP_BM_ER_R8_30]|nr:methyltransferase domain-containing protein [Chroococcidiopsidaceae cyanobacterium CP_BM_ER_R8_30]